ncbi:MAG: transporter [Clostridiales bacterium]|nr:transporter [Clostridiales bacterium]
MNKDKDNQRADNVNMRQPMKYQQFIQGPPFGTPGQRQPGPGPGRPAGPPFGTPGPGLGRPPGPPVPGPGRPGGQPPSAPPNFTPQLPREEEGQLLFEPSGSRVSGGRVIDFRRRPRDFRGCMNRFTYIWLINGNNFWFYPVFIGRNAIEGFRWRRNRWEYERIFTNRILFHVCF